MTATQSKAIHFAQLVAQQTVAAFAHTCGATIPEPERMILTAGIIAAQMGVARHVVQFSANDRAELARLTDLEVLAAVESLKL